MAIRPARGARRGTEFQVDAALLLPEYLSYIQETRIMKDANEPGVDFAKADASLGAIRFRILDT